MTDKFVIYAISWLSCDTLHHSAYASFRGSHDCIEWSTADKRTSQRNCGLKADKVFVIRHRSLITGHITMPPAACRCIIDDIHWMRTVLCSAPCQSNVERRDRASCIVVAAFRSHGHLTSRCNQLHSLFVFTSPISPVRLSTTRHDHTASDVARFGGGACAQFHWWPVGPQLKQIVSLGMPKWT